MSLIVFEGGDGCGKTTQLKWLAKHLQQLDLAVVTYRFPNRTTAIGQVLNSILATNDGASLPAETEHLLFTANRWEMMPRIAADLEAGKIVLLDRYLHSGIAYSVAKGLDMAWCQNVEAGLIEPDIVLRLMAPVQDRLARIDDRAKERYERIDFQRNVDQAFDELFSECPGKVYHIDASRSITNVARNIAKVVTDALLET